MRFSPVVLLLLVGCGESSVKLEDSGTSTTPDTDPTESEVDGAIAVTPTSLDYGVVFVGQSGDADITVRNVGEGEVSVTLSVVGGWATDYTLDAYTAAPAPGEISTHVLHVAPTEWGDHSVSVVVEDAVSGGRVEIPVTTLVQLDADGDGHGSSLTGGDDCDDDNASTNPSATEVWYDGVDSDCAGDDDFDQDHDGFVLEEDCDDTDATAFPGAPDTWYDGVDSDCAGDDDFDQDGDGVTVDTDCNDTDPTTTGPTEEVLDGADNDCDGNVDNVSVDTVSLGVVYGDGSSVGLGDKGTLALDADVDGDGVVDLVAASDQSGNGDFWLVSGTSFLGAAGVIDTVDTATGAGSRGYEPRYVATPALDVDGDGAAELLMNYSTEGSYDYGYTYAWDGASASGALTSGTALYSFTGDSSDDLLKSTAMGDFDGDGLVDFVAGSPLDNNGSSSDTGNVAFFFGDALSSALSIDDGTQIHGTSSNDYLGYFLAAGDVTGDGLTDVLAGAPGDDDGGSGAGAVYVFAGTSGTLGTTADSAAYAKLIAGSNDGLGEDPIPVPGDVDGDGVLDVTVASESEGDVWVFLGSSLATGTTATSSASYNLSGTAGDFGSAVVVDSDLDGDGADEIVVGADGADLNGSNSGGVYVFRWASTWSAALTTADATASFYGVVAGDYLGTGLSGGGDVNGDGLEDVAVGAVAVDSTVTDAGAIYLLPGW